MTNTWNAALYEDQHAFVWQYGGKLLDLLAPEAGESILDLGCGTGQLTAQLAQLGAAVRGMDADAAMIAKARQNYPDLVFEQADARFFEVREPLDAVFSNAALHWVKEPDAAIQCICRALKPGGRFVAEFGGKGNVNAITQALTKTHAFYVSPWYFPSVAEYSTRLEQQGLEVVFATLRDRPTPLEGADEGLANWLRAFANGFLDRLTPEQQTQAIASVEQQLKPTLYCDGRWIADYRRLRIMAIKP
ncbi:class I SAM-dependent methyltransferase [Altericista sp. CCNU0014]|uniref:class I SAM-dependent methyltransferase n=1 Tax=Altericista sp. CCNU0014 TaxID=3082949 RepID=UPI00385084FD